MEQTIYPDTNLGYRNTTGTNGKNGTGDERIVISTFFFFFDLRKNKKTQHENQSSHICIERVKFSPSVPLYVISINDFYFLITTK